VHGLLRRIWPIDRTVAGAPRPDVWRRPWSAHTFWNLIGLAALVVWALYWNHAIKKWHVKSSPVMWFQPYEFVSLDFLHNYQASRFWINGGDPFRADFGDPIGRKLCYPPIVLVYFAWCKLLPVGAAIAVWTIALGGCAAIGALAAWLVRREMGLTPVPIVFAVAAIVTSSATLYAMERGNYDLLLVPCAMLAAWGLRRTGWLADGVAGYALGLALCLKIYPGLLLAVPLLFGRWRTLGCTAAFVAAFLAFQSHNLPIFAKNLLELTTSHDADALAMPSPVSHSISYSWKALWSGTRFALLAKIPGTVAAGLIVGGLLSWIAWRLHRCGNPRSAILPVLFWVLAAATFVPKVSNDYNLTFLTLAVLAVWDRRDPVAVHVGFGMLVLMLQPLGFPIAPSVVLGIKIASLALAAYCLASRLRELTPIDPADRATEGFHAG
jgi:Glycosyltransferase family 87